MNLRKMRKHAERKRRCGAVLNPAPGVPLQTCTLHAGHMDEHNWPWYQRRIR